MDKSSQILIATFIGIAALSMLAQAAFTIGMVIGLRKAQKKAMALMDDVRLHALPALISSRELVQDLTPKIKLVSENLTALSNTLREKTDEIGGLVGDVTGRAQLQATRVDGMVKGTLDQLNSAVHAIEQGVAVPIRQVNGILSGFKAGVEVLRRKTPTEHLREAEEDLFV
jgi:hypothetical protein